MGIRLPCSRAFAAALGVLVVAALATATAQESRGQATPGPILRHLELKGATIFTSDDVVWLLRLRVGERLPGAPDHVGQLLQERYERDGYTEAEVDAVYDAGTGTLTLSVDEGRIDAIEFKGIEGERAEILKRDLAVTPGDIYNSRIVRRAINRLLATAQGALEIGPGDVELVERADKRVLVVPIDRHHATFSLGSSSEDRIEIFNPVDGFTPALSFRFVRFDHHRFNHTFITGSAGYAFAREEPALVLGFQQPLFGTRRVFVGAEVHDLSTSDDRWRLSHSEQALVALLFRNTFKDYYRRRGVQLFGAVQPHENHELVGSVRWDRHENLRNESDFSVFRDDHPLRPNLETAGGRLRSFVLAYTFDTRGLLDGEPERSYDRHLVEDLFRGSRRQSLGWRTDWTSEIAGHGLGGDYEFDRHILNTRTYVPISPRQSIAARLLVGFSGGTLPPERQFAIGGIGSVHGYAFKEAVGERMTLTNLEYRLNLTEDWRGDDSFGSLRLVLFFDAGRIERPLAVSTTGWLRGTGFGVQTGPVRVDFGFRLNDIPDSRQILVRLGPTF
jgi:outer membrane protein insertion porin family